MMDRQIKFRAWDNREKRWLFGYEMPNLGGFSLFGETVLLGEWASILDIYIFERGGHKQDDLKVMQFTGLKDKNGKEIYEGDLVQELVGHKRLHQIIWDEPECRFEAIFDGDMKRHIPDIRFMEVIGNIYENPKLLI